MVNEQTKMTPSQELLPQEQSQSQPPSLEAEKESGTSTIADSPSKPTPTITGSPSSTNVITSSPTEQFSPGDHVIRWEMLPIAWPIQIHGIILSVSDAAVVLVDFGLAAVPQQDENDSNNKNKNNNNNNNTDLNQEEGKKSATSPTGTTATTTTTLNMGPGKEEEEESSTPTSSTSTSFRKPSIFSSDPKEMEAARKEWMEKSATSSKKIMQSFQKLHPQKNKQRLNVIVLEDPIEWKKWKKVNYESGFFSGFGKNNTTNDSADSNNNNNNNPEGQAITNEQEKESKWWSKMKLSGLSKLSSSNLSQLGDDSTDSNNNNNNKMGLGWFRRTSTTEGDLVEPVPPLPVVPNETTTSSQQQEESTASNQWWKKMTNGSKDTNDNSFSESVKNTIATPLNASDVATTATGTGTGTVPVKVEEECKTPQLEIEEEESYMPEKKPPQLEMELEDSPDNMDETESQPTKKPTSFMNPAMARLMESRKDAEKETASRSKGGLFGRNGGFFGKSKSQEVEESQDTKPKKKLDLPKADPPKLVLARTRWLLEHGEAVLPPYHAFHSNSECIAVFCKTGYWSNLQADVFLHSTAIGNAKTMGAATLGVAASAPFLAPVIAGLGIGMVAAPWLILHSSKQQADDITLRMTNQFWAQAEPEVFVECIEHWSKLDLYYKQLEETQNKKNAPRMVSL